jgi:hypothetical protein
VVTPPPLSVARPNEEDESDHERQHRSHRHHLHETVRHSRTILRLRRGVNDVAAPLKAADSNEASRPVPLALRPSTGYDEGNQEKQDPDAADDVRHYRESSSEVARVGPDEANDCSYDEQGEHGCQPVEDLARGDVRIVARSARPFPKSPGLASSNAHPIRCRRHRRERTPHRRHPDPRRQPRRPRRSRDDQQGCRPGSVRRGSDAGHARRRCSACSTIRPKASRICAASLPETTETGAAPRTRSASSGHCNDSGMQPSRNGKSLVKHGSTKRANCGLSRSRARVDSLVAGVA